jgi:Lsr2
VADNVGLGSLEDRYPTKFVIGRWSTICATPDAFDRKEADCMAQKVIREFVDDLDGSQAERMFTFAVDGIRYEIDLSAEC